VLKHFHNCTTAEDVKIEYRRLCKMFHPDLGTSDEKEMRTRAMQEINVEYAQASAMFRQAEMREKARQQGKPEPTAQDFTDAAAVDERIRQAIEQIIGIEGLDIEICGLWVWVGGNTKENREQLKAAKFRWAAKKKLWYFAGIPAGGHREFTIDEIRENYGSVRVNANPRPSKTQQPRLIGRGDEE